MGFGTRFVKNVLLSFNFLVVLLALAIIGIGVAFLLNWTAVTKELNSHLTVAPWLFIVVGGIMLSIAFLGCCGAMHENHSMLIKYAIYLAVLITIQVVFTVLLFVYYDTLKEGIESIVDALFSMRPERASTTVIIETIQQQFSCCGSHSWEDYGLVVMLPDSCCAGKILGKCTIVNANPGCGTTLAYLYEKWHDRIAGTVIAVSCIEIVGVVFALRLATKKTEVRREGPLVSPLIIQI